VEGGPRGSLSSFGIWRRFALVSGDNLCGFLSCCCSIGYLRSNVGPIPSVHPLAGLLASLHVGYADFGLCSGIGSALGGLSGRATVEFLMHGGRSCSSNSAASACGKGHDVLGRDVSAFGHVDHLIASGTVYP